MKNACNSSAENYYFCLMEACNQYDLLFYS